MLANVLRTQARLGLRQAARVAVPATRSFSSLIASKAAVPAATWSAVRAFSSTPVATYERPERPRNPPSDTLFIGNIPWDATVAELTTLFSDFGAIVGEVRLPVGFDGRSRGFAHVTFEDPASALAAFNSAAEEPLHLNGRDLVLDFATGKTRNTTSVNPPNNKIYFSNFEQGEAALRELFSAYESEILSVFLLRDGNTGAALPSGFVEFSDIDVAQRVIDEFSNHQLPSGAKLTVNFARPKRERSDDRQGSDRNYGGDRRDRRSGGSSYSNRGYNSRGGDY